MTVDDRPIGWWLQHLTRLIDEAFDAAVAEIGLDRSEWQIMSTVADGAVSRAELFAAVRPFWQDGTDLRRRLGELLARGWLTEEPDRALRVTESGAAVRSAARARVEAIRQCLADGISAEDYERTISTLRTMASNLESRSGGSSEIVH